MRPRDLKALEFDLVVNRVADFAASPGGKEALRALTPTADRDDAAAALQATWECLRLIERNGLMPVSEFPDVRSSIRRATHEGFVLDGSALVEIRTVLQVARDVRAFLHRHAGDLSSVVPYGDRLQLSPDLRATLERTLDAAGAVTDDASDELAEVRRTLRHLRERVTKRLEQLLSRPTMEDLLSDRYVTLRNNRFVIPVKTAAAPHVAGVVQDRSVSGETTFIEPLFAVEMNNQLLIAAKEEERLVRRVLADLTGLVRAEAGSIRATYDVLVEIDALHARARFAAEYRCTQPRFDADEVKVAGARHPGLMIAGRPVVPIDLLLPRGKCVLVISGPNTGGKTVALKTFGLLALMAQSGLLLPVEEGSCMPFFSGVFADVGDEQSIANSLSTFSAHVANLVDVMQRRTQGSLVLLDEPGVGTDPEEGAALGIGVIRVLRQLGARIAVSTHFAAVKLFALSDDGCVTAAVQFDLDSMSPVYSLAYHSIGESMAFPIARRLGLPEATLQVAEASQTEGARTLAVAMERLQSTRREYERRLQALEAREAETATAQAESQRLLKELREKRKKRWSEELREARAFVRQLREHGRELLSAIEQGRADRRALNQFTATQTAAIAEHERSDPDARSEPTESPEAGDEIVVAETGIRGELLSIQGDRAWIQRGSMRFEVPASELRKVEKLPSRAKPATSIAISASPPADSPRELNLVGLRTREALGELDRFLDHAVRSSHASVCIIHGLGSGALRRAVADYLSTSPYCISFRAGEPGEGGAGVTIATLEVA